MAVCRAEETCYRNEMLCKFISLCRHKVKPVVFDVLCFHFRKALMIPLEAVNRYHNSVGGEGKYCNVLFNMISMRKNKPWFSRSWLSEL